MGSAELVRSLSIDGLFAGSLQRAGDSVRISVQLSSPTTGQTLWANSFDGEFRAMLGLEDRVARAVADQLRIGLSPEEGKKLSSNRGDIDPAGGL